MRDDRIPDDHENPFEYKVGWMQLIGTLVCIAIVSCALWALQADADEVFPDEEIFIGRTAVMEACFNEALKVASTINFETHEDYLDTVGMLTGGCMYYQLLENSTCPQVPFAYPIEPDDRPGEFEHQF